MSTDRVLNLLFGLIMAGFGWFLLTVYNDIRATQAQLNQLALSASRDYVRRDDLAEVKASLLRIEGKIDQKVDKVR